MLLYLTNGEFATEICDIGLEQGYIPRMGTRRLDVLEKESMEDPYSYILEPAIWFKVLVVDSIRVDCLHRSLSWNTTNIHMLDAKSEQMIRDSYVGDEDIDKILRKKRRYKKISESMYIGGDCFGYHTELDEVFDRTDEILKDYLNSKISKCQFEEYVFILLHCCILPFIHFNPDDLMRVTEAYHVIQRMVGDVEDEIVSKNSSVDRIRDTIGRQRDRYIADIAEKPEDVVSFPKAFVGVLLQDVNELIDKSMDEVEEIQNCVEELKRQELNNQNEECDGAALENSAETEQCLGEKRRLRDFVFARYHAVLLTREYLKEHFEVLEEDEKKKRKKKLSDSPEAALHDVYLGLHFEILEINKEIKELTDKKVLIVSVKEALRATLEDLQRGEKSYGIEVQKSGLGRATDVLRRSLIPVHWLSLTELVASCVLNKKCAIGKLHHNFCEEIVNKCNAAIFERELMDVAVNAAKFMDKASDTVSVNSDTGSISVENKLYNLKHKKPNSSFQEEPMESSCSCHASSEGIPIVPGCQSDSQCPSHRVSASSLGSVCMFEASPEDLISQGSLSFDNLKLTMDPNAHLKRKESGCLPLARISLRGSSNSTWYAPAGSPSNSTLEDSSVSFRIGESPGSKPDIPTSGTPENMDNLISVQTSDLGTEDDLVIIYDTERNYIWKSIEMIRGDIESHFDKIVKLLQDCLNKSGKAYYRKIWLAYESHLYDVISQPLLHLYEVEYSLISNNLSEMLPHLTVADLELEDSMILALMLGRQHGSLPKPREESFMSTSDEQAECQFQMDSRSSAQAGETEGASDHVEMRRSPSKRSSTFEKVRKRLGVRVEEGAQFPSRPITIYHPTSVTMVHSRTTWHIPDSVVLHETQSELGVDATSLDSKSHSFNERKSAYSDLIETPESSLDKPLCALKFLPAYRSQLISLFCNVYKVINEISPLLKLQHLTKCLRDLTEQVQFAQGDFQASDSTPGSDDLIDMVVIMLCNLDPKIVGQLYVHVMLLSDMLAPFLSAGPFSFTIVQFTVAFQFLQDKLVLKKRRISDRCSVSI